MSNDKESSAAGTDTRAPMLEETDYESWKIRMQRFIRSKKEGRKIWHSITVGPSPIPKTTEGVAGAQQQRDKREDEYTAEEDAIAQLDYLSQGKPLEMFLMQVHLERKAMER